VARHAQREPPGADPGGEHLAHEQPGDGARAQAEGQHETQGGRHREGPSPRAEGGEGDGSNSEEQGKGHTRETDAQGLAAAPAVHQQESQHGTCEGFGYVRRCGFGFGYVRGSVMLGVRFC
jgi:hypothetical protein